MSEIIDVMVTGSLRPSNILLAVDCHLYVGGLFILSCISIPMYQPLHTPHPRHYIKWFVYF